MKKIIAKLSKKWRWVIGIILGMSAANLSANPSDVAWILSMFFMAAFIGFVAMCLMIKSPLSDKELEQQRRFQELEDARAKREAEMAAENARKEEWNRTHGNIYTKLVGVTFKNDDGSSRQSILKEFAASGKTNDVELEIYDYQGEPAIRAKWEGLCCGNIPKTKVKDILAVADRIEIISMWVETFTPEDVDDDYDDKGRIVRASRDKIYRADLKIVYTKETEDDL